MNDLDALVGRYVTREVPRTFWEDSNAFIRFDTRQEAIEALNNPGYRRFVPAADWESEALREVQTFRPYSTDLGAAWDMVEQVSADSNCELRLRRDSTSWQAAFAGCDPAHSESAPVALCLAALMARGIHVSLDARAQ